MGQDFLDKKALGREKQVYTVTVTEVVHYNQVYKCPSMLKTNDQLSSKLVFSLRQSFTYS